MDGGSYSTASSALANTETTIVGGLEPGRTYDFRVRARSVFFGDSDFTSPVRLTTPGQTTCEASPTRLCLLGGRFQVEGTWQTASSSDAAQLVALGSDSGFLWFFESGNVEAVVKVLDGCAVNQRFWVFAGGLTNVRTVLTIKDTQTGTVKTYINPQGTAFQPVQDTGAFATCP